MKPSRWNFPNRTLQIEPSEWNPLNGTLHSEHCYIYYFDLENIMSKFVKLVDIGFVVQYMCKDMSCHVLVESNDVQKSNQIIDIWYRSTGLSLVC